jgi:hypothetical protein
MWKPPVEIVCLSLAVCGGAICSYIEIRYFLSESGLLSKDFFRCNMQGKILWIGFTAIIAMVFLIDALLSP